MKIEKLESVSVVNQIKCDRCGKLTERGEFEFHSMTSIDFNAGYDSVFGDGNRIEIDICEPCLKDTLGSWIRLNPLDARSLPTMLSEFDADVHGGEFPSLPANKTN